MTPSRGVIPAPRSKPAAPAPVARETAPPALLHRALRAPGALRPAEVLALQRSVGNRAVGRLLAGAAPRGAVQRKLGLELELAVPIDNAGDLSEDDHKILRGEKTDLNRLQQIRNAADAGYGEFGSLDGVAFHADHSSRVLPKKEKFPLRVLGRSILELVFDPAVETREELGKTLEQLGRIVDSIDDRTDGLKKRSPLGSTGVHVGPVDGSDKPPQLSYEAMIHVNLGIDPRRLHGLLGWYSESKYKPSKEDRSIPMEDALLVADEVVKAFSGAYSDLKKEDVQSWNGLRGLTVIYVLYLLSGKDDSPISSSVKNFATILTKTRFSDIIVYGMTLKEQEALMQAWEVYIEALLQHTRPKEGMDDPLIRRTRPGTKDLKSNWSIGSLFQDGSPTLISEEKEIRADDVGPERSKADKVTGGGRRKGIVLEFRSLPARYPPEQWKTIAEDFMDEADRQNAQKDYVEPKKVSVKEKPLVLEDTGVEKRVSEIRQLQLPSISVRNENESGNGTTVSNEKPSSIIVTQSETFWVANQTVTWQNASYRVVKRIKIGQYELEPL